MTKRRIGSAYLELRHRYPIERVRITELCRLANTNRTTFYHYFEDIYHLNEEVENRILEECFENFAYRGLIYTDPERYYQEFNKALTPRMSDLLCLGEGRESQQHSKLQKWLVKLALKDDESQEEELIISFAVGGIAQLISLNRETKRYTEDEIRPILNQLTQQCLALLLPKSD